MILFFAAKAVIYRYILFTFYVRECANMAERR